MADVDQSPILRSAPLGRETASRASETVERREDVTDPLGPRRAALDGWLVATVIAIFIALTIGAGLDWRWAGLGAAGILSVAWLTASRDRAAVAVTRPVGPGRVGRWPDSGLRVGLDAIDQPCILVDTDGTTRHANPAAVLRFGGLRSGDPLSFGLRVTVVLDAVARLAAGSETDVETADWTERVPMERWYRAVLTPIRLPTTRTDGRPPRPDFVLIRIIDRTEAYLVERMRVDFVANASHELRTPLASLIGFVETLRGPARDDANARERFLAIMLDQANRMKRLIDDLLSLSRVEMRAHVRPDTAVDLASIARHVADALGPLAREAEVQVELEIPSRPIMVLGDRDELVQVVSNLLENAIKYGGTAKRVRLGLRQDASSPREAVLEVQDWGPGIAREHLPRLTERFYRADALSSREKKGTGLGLAIVKHIVTRHRGHLKIDSELGKGAIFQVRLDVSSPPQQ
jgi:two-component system phosphate regulon sensor histidine kinase PhoR